MAREKILIVEDENIVAMDIKKRVEDLGYAVPHMAATGEDAIRKAEEIPPDLILMDIKLKGDMDGIEAAEKIREQFCIPFVYLTAYADEDTLDRAKRTKPFGYIMKPVNDMELRSSIEIALFKHKTENEVSESEGRFRTILDSINEGYFEVDLTGKFSFINDWFCKLAGDPKDKILQMNNRDYMDEESAKSIYRIFNEIYRTGIPATNIEHEIITTKGEHRFHELSASLMRNQRGQPIGFRGIVRDITERKNSETLLKALAEESLQSLLIIQDFRIVFANQAFADMAGYTINEIYSLTEEEITNLVHPEDQVFVWGRFRDRLAGKPVPPHYEFRGIRKDGTERWLEMFASLIDYQGRPAIRLAIVDITERRNAEEALRESEAKYRQMVEHAPTAIYELDVVDFRFTKVNDVMCQIMGYSEDELLSMDPLELFVEESKQIAVKEVEKILSGQDVADTGEYRLKTKGGRVIWAQVNARIIHEGENSIKAFTVAQDVSERKALEEKLLLSRHFQAISELAGGIAHEFNNALTGILGNIELLKMEISQSSHIGKYVEPMKTSCLRMARLTNHLLAYARGGKYDPKTIPLNDLVKDMLPLLKQGIDASIRLETDFPRATHSVKVDVPQMQMVLAALIQNSLEAIEGEGRIMIRTTNTEISNEMSIKYQDVKPGRYVSVTVEDDGAGMDKETKARVFDPFFSTKLQGRGLGMSAVYGSVRNHGGWIEIDSEPSEGTVVTIYLPAVEAAADEEKGQKTDSSIKGTGTALVIEDEEIGMNVIRELLENLGYRVLEAKTGAEAINIAESYEGDIEFAVLDIKLPDMSGEKVYAIISETRPNLKVLVCSGYSLDDRIQGILDSGAQGFLQKPFSLEALSEKLVEIKGSG
jgi:PAS domain S-box-containing protein